MRDETKLRFAQSVSCPRCGAAPYDKCVTRTGTPMQHSHASRAERAWEMYDKAVAKARTVQP